MRPKLHKQNGQLQGLALEFLKKFDVDLDKIKDEVDIPRFEMIDYEEKAKFSVFGEKESICYETDFVIYNINFQAKLLTFEYASKSELLKLDINCKTPSVIKEIRYCCNSLQRRRNLNLMFSTLISFARYIESRRLIISVLLKKNKYVTIEENKDGGKIVVYSDTKRFIKVGVFWSLEYNSDYVISDKVEVYYKSAELPSVEDIKNQLSHLTEPHLEFIEKYHLWKKILDSLSFDPAVIIVDKDICTDRFTEKHNGVTSTNSEGVSVIRFPNLIPKKEVKIEDSDEELIDDSFSDLSIIQSDKEVQENILTTTICLDSSTTSDEQNSHTSQTKEVIIELPSDTEDNDVNSNSRKTLSNSRHSSDIEVEVVPSKKSRMSEDDDLEITGITYLVPD